MPSDNIEGGGANFVDASLRVVVKQAKGTLMVFRPEFYHGTTLAAGAINCAVTYAFSKRVVDAWREMQEEQGVQIIEETGEGNPYT